MQASRWNLVWAIPWMVLTFILVQALVWLPIFLLGVLVVPALQRWGSTVQRPSLMPWKPPVDHWANRWADALFGNPEDGVKGDLPWQEGGGTVYGWFLRNSVCNMRYWPLISAKANLNTRFVGVGNVNDPGARFVAWTGFFVGAQFPFLGREVWIGWAVNPRDATALYPESDWRCYGYSTVAQAPARAGSRNP
jgi:hypothetical protein